ncbi:hypothetical protein CF140_14420 [Aeromonas sobria]|nr:hypothetical protein CF140_14420 [Aeromonas sobria]
MSAQATEISAELDYLKSIWNEYIDISNLVSARLLNNIDTKHSMLRSREYWALSFASNCCSKILLSSNITRIINYPFKNETDKLKYNIFATISLLTGLRVAFDSYIKLSIEQVLVKEYLDRIQQGDSISADRDNINSGLMAIKISMDCLTNKLSLIDVATEVFAKLPNNIPLHQLWNNEKPTRLLTDILIDALSPVQILKKHYPEILGKYNSELVGMKYLTDIQDWLTFLNDRIEFLTGYKLKSDGTSTLALLRTSKDTRLTEEDKILMGSNSEDVSNKPKFRW